MLGERERERKVTGRIVNYWLMRLSRQLECRQDTLVSLNIFLIYLWLSFWRLMVFIWHVLKISMFLWIFVNFHQFPKCLVELYFMFLWFFHLSQYLSQQPVIKFLSVIRWWRGDFASYLSLIFFLAQLKQIMETLWEDLWLPIMTLNYRSNVRQFKSSYTL